MAANNISTLATKRERQIAKLDLAALDRAAAGNERATYDLSLLPTVYAVGDNNTNNVIVNDNVGGLVSGRPWTTGSSSTSLVLTRSFPVNTGQNQNFTVEERRSDTVFQWDMTLPKQMFQGGLIFEAGGSLGTVFNVLDNGTTLQIVHDATFSADATRQEAFATLPTDGLEHTYTVEILMIPATFNLYIDGVLEATVTTDSGTWYKALEQDGSFESAWADRDIGGYFVPSQGSNILGSRPSLLQTTPSVTASELRFYSDQTYTP